tara:strand:+ start:173 stop:538 length:366 start_codon:yes stop_codon:yes gene_type:complete
MKKIALTIGLIAAMLSTNAQDTTCTYFTGNRIIEFDYENSIILFEIPHLAYYYDVEVKYGNTLCLHFADEKLRVRKVITTFFDGTTKTAVLDSKDDVYFSPKGTSKVSVSKPRFIMLPNFK